MNFPYSSFFDPVSSPSNHLLKNNFFTSFFISDSTVLRKMDHFDIQFVIWKSSRSRELTKPTLLDPDHFPGSLEVQFVIWKHSRSRELTKPTCLDPDHFPGSLYGTLTRALLGFFKASFFYFISTNRVGGILPKIRILSKWSAKVGKKTTGFAKLLWSFLPNFDFWQKSSPL